MLAAVAMAMSSVTVVGNSILLGRYKPKLSLAKAELHMTHTKKDTIEQEVTDDLISKTSIR
jgi:hypothetical protein